MHSDDTDENREIFLMFDKKGDGQVECKYLGDMLRVMGLNPTQLEVNKLMTEVDPKGEKTISFEEFIPIYSTQKGKSSAYASFDAIVEVFRSIDIDNNGMIKIAEIRHLLSGLGEKLTFQEVDILLDGMEDSNGMLNYEEFVREMIDK